ncbi:hypothetical protein SAMN05660242_1687 [Thermoanaerobacterium sp. RBIITD]|nr:hypothetical protein SAMN05660242_1687 [Thermoanaerobacterium sp. RBIITD]
MFFHGFPVVIIYLSVTYLFLLIVILPHFQTIPEISALLYALLIGFTGISIIFSDVNFQIKLQVILLSLLFIISDFILYKIIINKRKKQKH